MQSRLDIYCKVDYVSKLKALYIEEHDERKQLIRQKCGMPLLMITSLIILFAGMVAGYFNITVYYTLILTAAIQLFICAVLKFIYLKLY